MFLHLLFSSNKNIKAIKTIRIVFLLLILFFPGIVSWSVNKPFRFVNPELKLPEANIYDITEDYKGFIWIATQNGLCRYDGNEVITYIHKFKDSTTISSNFINFVYESRDSVLFIGTMNGLNIYDRDNNSFIRVLTGIKNPNYNVITDIDEDNYGNFWIATRGGVFAWNRKENKIVTFKCKSTNHRRNVANRLRSVLVLNNGDVIAGNSTGELYSFNVSDTTCDRLTFDDGTETSYRFGPIRRLYKTSDGMIWVGTENSGLVRISKIKNGHIWFRHYMADAREGYLSGNTIFSFCELDSNRLLIGTENYGLNIYDKRSDRFTVYTADNKVENSISGNSIWSIYKDRSGNIWLGIFDSGINIVFSSSLKIKDYKNNICNPNSPSYGSVMSIVEDEIGNMWVGYDGYGLDYWDRKENVFHHYRNSESRYAWLLSDVPICLMSANNGDIWASFYGGGVSVINRKDGAGKRFVKKDGNSWLHVMDMVQDENGNIYFGTMGGGLKIYNPETDKLTVFKKIGQKAKQGISNNFINKLFLDRKGNLWIGFVGNGLDKMYRDSTGNFVFKNYHFEDEDSFPLIDNRIYSITEDKSGKLWIGTNYGLNKLNPVNGKVTQYLNGKSLMANVVVGIIEDDKGRLWISTYDGLSMFNPETEKFVSYSEKGRLSSQKFTKRGASYKSSKGELLFGGKNGFISFYPDSIKRNVEKLNLYFTDFLLFNKPVKIGTPDSPLNKFITEAEKITLKPGQTVFTIKYVAVNFKNPEKVQYAYYMDGFEDKWNYVGNKREATYTNLDPGSYTFKVKCKNTAGIWSKKPTTIKVVVLPPWWKTKTFYLMITLVVFIILVTIHNYRIRFIARKKRILERLVKERTRELKEANEYLEKRSEEILQQKEELNTQADNLSIINAELEEKTEELIVYQTRLEELVRERTAELERAKEKAEESERLKSSFLANMSHEIRTPMNAIVGFSQLLKTENLDDESKNLFISQINSNTETLLTLIDDILDLSRIESGQLIIIKEEFYLNELLEEVMAGAKVSKINDKIELRLVNTAEEQNLKLFSDRTRIKQILSNLINNACKFTDEGFVELRFETDQKNIKFIVKDTGIGIPESKLNEIFDRFRVVSKKSERIYGGAGLGLAISKKLAHLLGGTIEVSSVVNEGSVFILILPYDIVV
ncbi:MAG: hypothetical protein GXO47_12575 [Chlorobi bacterium]|nr:hypothetical protein [Chlorobiota bacterium]